MDQTLIGEIFEVRNDVMSEKKFKYSSLQVVTIKAPATLEISQDVH